MAPLHYPLPLSHVVPFHPPTHAHAMGTRTGTIRMDPQPGSNAGRDDVIFLSGRATCDLTQPRWHPSLSTSAGTWMAWMNVGYWMNNGLRVRWVMKVALCFCH
ncbi:uncharacterized protein [Physcomitrium patens]|uniref:uncharacterized protein n=1 Tax=Physcomitrium patens TaxID=3218 RepID=UPI003CCE16A9